MSYCQGGGVTYLSSIRNDHNLRNRKHKDLVYTKKVLLDWNQIRKNIRQLKKKKVEEKKMGS